MTYSTITIILLTCSCVVLIIWLILEINENSKERKQLESSLDYYRSKHIDESNLIFEFYQKLREHYEIK